MDVTAISPEMFQPFQEAAQGMGVAEGKQDLNDFGVVALTPVTCYTTFFAEFGWQKDELIFHLFPRGGAADEWHDAYYPDKTRYIPGRREYKPVGVNFPPNMRAIIEAAANEVTFGDVELSHVEELDAWALRFKDAGAREPWVKEGGLLEKLCSLLDLALEGRA